MNDLIDSKGIAQQYGLSQQYVTDRLVKHHNFPEPVVNVTQKMRRWKADEVAAFIRTRQRRAEISSADSR